jgi:hypothetical protein
VRPITQMACRPRAPARALLVGIAGGPVRRRCCCPCYCRALTGTTGGTSPPSAAAISCVNMSMLSESPPSQSPATAPPLPATQSAVVRSTASTSSGAAGAVETLVWTPSPPPFAGANCNAGSASAISIGSAVDCVHAEASRAACRAQIRPGVAVCGARACGICRWGRNRDGSDL